MLSALANRLRAAGSAGAAGVDGKILQKVLGAAAAKVERIPLDGSFEECEDALAVVEASLVKAILRGVAPEQLALVESRVAEGLGDVAGVSAEVVDRMRRALRRREVRRLLGLPPLTLLEG
jgi:hypothetical protein